MSSLEEYSILHELLNKEIKMLDENLLNINFFLEKTDNNIVFKKYCCQKQNIIEILKQKTIILKDIEKYLKKNCKHDWNSDLIDNMSVSQEPKRIYYCNKCGLYK